VEKSVLHGLLWIFVRTKITTFYNKVLLKYDIPESSKNLVSKQIVIRIQNILKRSDGLRNARK